ncbi:MAG: peptide chain release factor 2 [Burkholderiales bacterium]
MEAERINQIASSLADLQHRSAELRRYLDLAAKQQRLAQVEQLLSDSQVWSDPQRAQDLGKEKKALEAVVGTLGRVGGGLADAQELFELARAEGDDATVLGVASDLEKLEQEVAGLEFRRMFSNALDPNNCFVDIQAGSGGTEAQDWAAMLERMYLKYCDRKGFRAEVLEHTPGEVAGIKSATLKVMGDYAYGHLRTEVGVHRLVRKSPFDSNARRHTSFASVFVYPEIDETIEVEINPADLRIDTYRASGAGGQHVNKTDSAVRITHLPTGIVVSCQNERSQAQNKERAMAVLRAKLVERQQEEREAEMARLRGDHVEAGWGNQIRSYVLQPYTMVKDHRTNVEAGNAQGVLDGDLDQFVRAELLRRAGDGAPA